MINELEATLKQALRLNKPTSECLVQIIMAIIVQRTVNLKKLACCIRGGANIDSQYRRLQRLFVKVSFPQHAFAKFMASLFFSVETGLYLSLDRTNWKWGRKDLNFLVLSACYKGAAIPLYWIALDKKGASNTAERIQIMDRFITGFGLKRIAGLLADREFEGIVWLAYLKKEGIPFDIRMKKSCMTTNAKGRSVRMDSLFKHLKVGECSVIKTQRKMMKQSVFLSALRLPDGELLIVVTNRAPEGSIERYGRRWEIETLFSCLKGRGFNFEETRLTDLPRIESMFGVLALAFAWAHKVGDWRDENQKSIPIKKHGRRAISFFRYGLDWIVQALFDMHHRLEQLCECIRLFVKSAMAIRATPVFPQDQKLC